MSRDQMQDVFPVVFDFVKGEQPTAEKLTGLVKHTDSGFSRITQGIGDPWDYAAHTNALGSSFSLSPVNLGQSSLARILGSSDWMSPPGGCWNEASTTAKTITLSANRNSWTLGFPLVRVSPASSISADSDASVAVPLTWSTHVSVTDTDGILTTEVGSLDLVVANGDFFVDYYKGTITSYSSSQYPVVLEITNLNMFGAGVPWGTHNVIPHWDQSLMCDVQQVSATATTTTYTMTFPLVSGSARTVARSNPSYGRSSHTDNDKDTTWTIDDVGEGSLYRLPLAITSTLSTGDLIPEGYCLLWDGGQDGRVIPSVSFYYINENTISLVTPLDWLNVGENYRLIISGTSAAENINHLIQTVRNNEHVGLTANPSLSYTIPLSHDNLENRFASNLDATLSTVNTWKFRESDYPTNCHPQYLHRGGYMEDDDDGNTANAMRGDLVMAGHYLTGFELGQSSTAADVYQTAALAFGGGNTDKRSGLSNMFLRFEGVESANTYDAWTTGWAKRIPFGLDDTGATSYSAGGDTESFGALSLYPWRGAPLYLRGAHTGTLDADDLENGAVLGFDMGQRNEANYIRLMKSVRSTTNARPNLPANVGQSATAILSITPNLSSRIVSDQIREFRFRAVSYVENATNTADSLGGSNTRSVAIPEFEHHYTSPAIVGADFFNVYSNAIFFSDLGDGETTSFTEQGSNWLNNGTAVSTPTGIYFNPNAGAQLANFSFNFYDSVTTLPALSVGPYHGFHYQGAKSWTVVGDTQAERLAAIALESAVNPDLVLTTSSANNPLRISTWGATSPIQIASAQSDVNLIAQNISSLAVSDFGIISDTVTVATVSNIGLSALGQLNLNCTGNMGLTSSSALSLSGTSLTSTTSGSAIISSSTSNVILQATSGYVSLSTDEIYLNTPRVKVNYSYPTPNVNNLPHGTSEAAAFSAYGRVASRGDLWIYTGGAVPVLAVAN